MSQYISFIEIVVLCLVQTIFGQNDYNGGSISEAENIARNREVDIGGLQLNRGYTNSHSLTRGNGLSSEAESNAFSRGLNIGRLNLGSRLTHTRSETNGAISHGLGHDFNVGNLGIGTSIDRNNLGKGLKLQQSPDGGYALGFGALNIGLNSNRVSNGVKSQAQADAQGIDAQAIANSNSRYRNRQFGNIGIKDTIAQSNAASQTHFGRTSAGASGNI